jgi:tetratricopeptide (TPR) repeat protein
MSFDARQMVRVAKRMREATGYLELGMAQHALDRLEGLGASGPLEAEVEWIRGAAMQKQHRYEEAAVAFERAARMAPSPADKSAWLALSVCYKQVGDVDRAVQMLGLARGAHPPKPGPHIA